MILQHLCYDIGGEAVVGRQVGEGDLLRPDRRRRSTEAKQQQAHKQEAAAVVPVTPLRITLSLPGLSQKRPFVGH